MIKSNWRSRSALLSLLLYLPSVIHSLTCSLFASPLLSHSIPLIHIIPSCLTLPLIHIFLPLLFSLLINNRYKKFQGEWDDIAAEEQAFKKFKKGKVSKDIYEEALLAESAPDGDEIVLADKKG